MPFAIFAFAASMFFLGLGLQSWQLGESLPGTGPSGMVENYSVVAAQQAMVYATNCTNMAIANAGVAGTFTVTMPTSVNAPSGATCEAIANAGGGRDVYASLPSKPGMASQIVALTNSDATWWRVSASGQAIDLTTAQVAAVPTTLAVGNIIEWSQVKP